MSGDLNRQRRRKASPDVIKTDRLPPHAIDAEMGVLGCIMLSPLETIPQCQERLRDGPDEFYDLRHQIIYRQMLAMHEKHQHIDTITLMQRLKDCELLDQIGGVPYLIGLQDSSPSAENISYYLDIVSDKYTLRSLVRVCTDIVGSVYESQESVEMLQDQAERDVLAISRRNIRVKNLITRDVVSDSMGDIETLMNSNGKITGISTGFSDLDYQTNGMHPGDMIIISAFTSSGKTSLAMNIAENVAIEQRLPVGVFTLEMTAQQLMTRMICSLARVNQRDIRNGMVPADGHLKITQAAGRIASSPIFFDDTGGLSIYDLRARARRLSREHGIKLFVVDYLQLLNAIGGPRKIENRQQEVADISNGLKAMAKELGAVVITLSQLNDDGKLRESRAPGMDTDNLWEIESIGSDSGDYNVEVCKLWLRKNRNGARGIHIDLTFLKSFTRFENAAKVSDEDIPADEPRLPHI